MDREELKRWIKMYWYYLTFQWDKFYKIQESHYGNCKKGCENCHYFNQEHNACLNGIDF